MTDQTYLVTARKYRPQLFGDVVAQVHVTETLKNAIRLDRLAHAYMFTGPRGVGKTTAARILAKAINCTTPLEDREDRSEPCRTCMSCKSFEEARNLNIIEIDAASNNKVEDVRDLRETVRIPPQGGRMKVYIIDEVHMLTTSAFNALLKTLEEPPPYVLFIFATTEPHKVLPTIQSRCQRFDFRRIAVPEIILRLKDICAEEKITSDESSLMLIARKGDGALRDALSVFDQSVSLCGTTLVYEEIIKALGVVDADLYFDVTDAAAGGEVGRMIQIVEHIVRSGYDLQEFLDGLAEHLRNLLVIKTVGDRTLLETTSQIQERYDTEAARFSESVLLRHVHIVGETSDSFRNTRQPRLRLEMALLKMASLPSALDIRTALEKIERLEIIAREPSVSKKSEEGSTTVLRGSPGGQSTHPATPESSAVDVQSGAVTPRHAPSGKSREKKPSPEASQIAVPSEAEYAIESDRDVPSSMTESAPKSTAPLHKAGPPGGEATTSSAAGALKLPFDAPALKRADGGTENAVQAVSGESTEHDMGDVAVLAEAQVISVPDALSEAWTRVVSDTMENQIRLGSLLQHTRILSLHGDDVVIGVPDAFHERILRSERSRLSESLEQTAKMEIGDLQFSVCQEMANDLQGPNNDSFDARAFLKKKCEDNPAVKSLVERFGGEIVW